ncbi:polysaccharide biosynthesis/export family protein [uncultured Shimia sp.]|uniref:polysaccharide biosynthesis/export family protein n=1 Tax=uncultured Shimia sp. TaxID=573152 RepID=UPI002603356A|nr:polysaccharide biosynthesis/export family protein [uncultured Shimia sp.]
MLLRLNKIFLTATVMAVFLIMSVVSATAQNNYVIRSGDTLQVEVLEDSSLNRSTLVLPDGSISFPMAGTVQAQGKSVDQLRQSLSTALASNFAAAPNVYVSVASLAAAQPSASTGRGTMDVYAVGEFAAPGRKEVKRGTTLLQFIAEAGGLGTFAADKRIELHRTHSQTGKITTYRFNYRVPAGGDSGIGGGTQLAPGDVVKIPQRKLFE